MVVFYFGFFFEGLKPMQIQVDSILYEVDSKT